MVDANTEVNATGLAVVIGVTARRVQQMAQDGTIPTVSRGKFNLPDAVQRYIDFRVREKDMTQAEMGLQEAELSLKRAKAAKAGLEVEELQGKMHRSEDVAAMTEDLIYSIRGMLISLPGRLAIDAANLTDPAEVSALIRKEVHQAMEELSRYWYDSKKYEERVRERMSWDKIDEGADPDE